MENLVTVKDFEEQANKILDKNARDYYNSGANHELALKQNQEMFNYVKINPRVLRNVSNICMKTKVMGRELALPFGIAPTAMQGLAHSGAEKNPIRAAGKHGTIVTLSTLSTTPIEEVVQASPDTTRWFQLYVTKNREITKNLVKDAEINGFSALVLTIDAPQLGKREADQRNKFSLPPHLKLAILEKYSKFNLDSNEGSGLLKFFSDQIDASLNWEDVKWLQSITKLPVVLKGIQCREDAELAGRVT
jgi:(S)-2-hydroxy-acid oxidase